mgnify:FL=1
MSEHERRTRHVDPKHKSEAVIRVLKGESVSDVAAELGVRLHRLERWQNTFLAGGLEALEKESKVRHRSAVHELQQALKPVLQWVGLFVVLALTILFLVRFLNTSSPETGG